MIALDVNRRKALQEMADELRSTLARAICKGISKEEVHQMVEEIYEEFGGI